MSKKYLICYDISDEKRLAKLAKTLEKEAMRVQYSIFLSVGWVSLAALREKIEEIIDAGEDDVRIYEVKDDAITLGQAIDFESGLVF